MEPVARVGRDQRLGLLHRAQNRACVARWLAKYFEDTEKCGGVFMAITYWRYGETWRSVYDDHILEIWRNMAECLWRSHIGDMEKHDGVFMVITYWRYGETWRSVYGDHVLEFVKE